MAELIWENPNAAPGAPMAEYRACGKVKVTVMAPPTSAADGGDAPAWVQVAAQLMRARAEEYARETGHAPALELMEAFQRDRGAALEEWIRDPKGSPYRYMSLREYEEAEKC